MAGRKTSGPPPDNAPLILLGGVAAAGFVAYFGAPPFPVLWLTALVAAWMAQPPVLTKKGAGGVMQPANPGEKRQLARWTMWQQMRLRLLLPSSDWLPGWPPLASWAVAVLTGAACFLWPVRAWPRYHVKIAAEQALDAIAGAWLVASVASARRAADGPDRPATRFDGRLLQVLRESPLGMAVAAGIGASLGALVGLAAAKGLVAYHHWAARWAVLHPHRVPPPGWAVASPHIVLLSPILAVGGALAGIGIGWHRATTGHWRKVKAHADEWEAHWAALKIDPPPVLVDHRVVGYGAAEVWTFDAPPGLGARAMWPQAKKFAPVVGAGRAVAVLERPDGTPGTRHPIMFDVVAWSDSPDLTDPDIADDVVLLAAHSRFAWATEFAGYGRPVPVSIERVSTTGSPSAWASRWAWPDGPSLAEIKAIYTGVEQAFGCEVLLDHRQDVVFFGALDSDGVPPELADHIAALREERIWDKRWSQIQGIADHPPICQAKTGMTAELADGTEVHRQAFVVRQGLEVAELRGLEPKIATTMRAAPFVAICGWPAPGGRPGDRHPQGFVIYWSQSPVPTSPERLADSDASSWVLAGMLNKAFDAAKLPRPELAGAVELSMPDQKSHLWELRVRLFDGVTVAYVRSQAARLQQALQVSWLRVAACPEPDVAVIYAGARPEQIELADEDVMSLLTALDWEQAWLDSKVTGASGEPPKLMGCGMMPHNQNVLVLDFSLPAGIDRAMVKAAKGRLRTATGNAFVEDVDSPLGADAVRLLVSRDIPLPRRAQIEWSLIENADRLTVPIGTGIDGEPVCFNLRDSPHLLVVGATGTGKSTLLQVLVFGWLAKGAGVVVIDPIKGGADFVFAAGRAAIARDLDIALIAMRAAYAEATRRKQANVAARVSSWLDVDDPPPPLVVLVDEFTSVLLPSQVPKRTGDPELDAEIDLLEMENRSRIEIGMLVAKLAREARSAGVVVILAAQKLAADTLEKIPGKDLKTNLGRVLLGNASDGERLSALRAPRDAPALSGDIPQGRGLYEPMRHTAVMAQFWYASQAELAQRLSAVAADVTPPFVLGQEDDTIVAEMSLSLADLEEPNEATASAMFEEQFPQSSPPATDDVFDVFSSSAELAYGHSAAGYEDVFSEPVEASGRDLDDIWSVDFVTQRQPEEDVWEP